MAWGPMSVGSESALSLLTDKLLQQENMAADAKATGDALKTKFDKTGGELSGDVRFAAIGDVGVSKKLLWGGSTDGAEVYY